MSITAIKENKYVLDKTHTPVVFLWRFDNKGFPCCDTGLVGLPQIEEGWKHIQLRKRFQIECKLAVLHLPGQIETFDIQSWLDQAKINSQARDIMLTTLDQAGRSNNDVRVSEPSPKRIGPVRITRREKSFLEELEETE